MRILVTGGAGFIGSHTVDALLAAGHEVRVLDSLEPPVHAGRRPDYLPADVEFIAGSVADRDDLARALAGVTAVFHFAAYQDYLTDFSHFFSTNSVGTALLYELIVNERLPVSRVIVASSQAVYGEGLHSCDEHGLLRPGPRAPEQLERGEWELRCPFCDRNLEPQWTDEKEIGPHNSYGISKRDQEDLAIKLGRRYGIPSVALRYSIVQGPRQSFRNAYSGALRSFAVCALSGNAPVLYEDGRQLRDYVSIHDVVRANMTVFRDPSADYEVFNVGGGRRITVLELSDLVVTAAGTGGAPLMSALYRVGDTRHIVSDTSKLRALGWEPMVRQEAIVDEYVRWAQEQPDLTNTFVEAERRMRAAGVLQSAC